jgi:bifunctional N-acetylglucosamine-1-phosphate-uridyltransferase/glucosamine-1-phosphate-acetyltransferase GlmU-like protein
MYFLLYVFYVATKRAGNFVGINEKSKIKRMRSVIKERQNRKVAVSCETLHFVSHLSQRMNVKREFSTHACSWMLFRKDTLVVKHSSMLTKDLTTKREKVKARGLIVHCSFLLVLLVENNQPEKKI